MYFNANFHDDKKIEKTYEILDENEDYIVMIMNMYKSIKKF